MTLAVAFTGEKIIMIETGASEVPEQIMIDTIFEAHEVSQEVIGFVDIIMAGCSKEKHSYENYTVPRKLFAAIREIVTPQGAEEAVFTDDE